MRVSPAKPRLLQGETMPVVIDARYFFGEPVANAQVKYRVYHSPHYWWDQDGGGDEAPGMDAGDGGDDSTPSATTPPSNRSRPASSTPMASSPSACLRSTSPTRRVPRIRTTPSKPPSPTRLTGRSPAAGAFSPPAEPSASSVEPVSYAIRAGDTALFNVTAVDYDNHPGTNPGAPPAVDAQVCQWQRPRPRAEPPPT